MKEQKLLWIVHVRKGDQEEKNADSSSVTSNSSLCFEAIALKFCFKTPHINAIKVANQIFEILSWSRDIGVFLS